MILISESRFFPRYLLYILYIISSIHPRYKHDVGYRLSRAGLAVAYGQQVEFQGPIVQTVAYSSGGQTISITYGAVSDIELRNSAGFEVYTIHFHSMLYLFLLGLLSRS
jgi:hypothetical protein